MTVSTFLAQIIYLATLYSIYMTLQTWIIWVYIIMVGFNVFSGFFSVWVYEGSRFYVYLLILVYYVIACYKMYYDSRPFRRIGERGEDNFYFGIGIRHILDNARSQYRPNNTNDNHDQERVP